MNFSVNTTTHKPRHVETTDWEEILVKKGIWEEREEVTLAKAAKAEARARGEKEEADTETTLQGLTLEELSRVEDEYAQHDTEEETLAKIREARKAEMKAQASLQRFGDIYPLARADFMRDVSEGSKDHWVIVEMFKNGIEESTKCSELLRIVAKRQKAVQFFRIRSTDCVDGWPDDSVPCMFLYHEGKMQKQLIGLDFCDGPERATADSCEKALAALGAFKTVLGDDPNTATHASIALGKELDQEFQEVLERSEQGAMGRRTEHRKNVADLPIRKGTVLDKLDDDDDDW